MGNRATIVFTDGKGEFSPAVYLHWNGGPESVYAFLAELTRRGVRPDCQYDVARFIQLVGEFFDQDAIGGYSLGVSNGPKNDSIAELDRIQTDHGDNGLFLVNRTDKDLAMRRFTEKAKGKDGHYSFVEWDAEHVANEREVAQANQYSPDIAATFIELQGKRTISAYELSKN